MNNLGFSKDSVNIGDFRIKGEGETLIIGNENGGDGYILPTEKGTEGQVITMNADNTTSFQDSGASTIERPIQNLFTMLTPRTSYTTGNPDPYQVSSSGSNVIDTADFQVGDVIRVRAEGYYVNTALNPATSPCTIQHQWFISYPNSSPSNETLSTPVSFNGSGGNWFNEIIFTWESATSVRITFNGKINYNTGFAVSDDVRALDWFVGGAAPPGTERPKTAGAPYYFYPPPSLFEIIGQNLTVSGSGYAIATNYYIDKMNTDALVSGGGSPTIDHLALSNLNAGDAGHAQFALLQGRSGGQILSGGITPANFLTLKSHTAGLNNIVIKDLNTTFEKNIDMNNNNIDNVFEVNSANTLLLGNSTNDDEVAINPNINSGVIAYASTGKKISLVADGGNNVVNIEPTKTDFLNNIDMTGNDINSVVNINIDDTGRIENTNNGYSLRNSRDGPTDNIFIAPTENIFFKSLNLQSGVNIIFPFPNNQIGHPFIGEKLQVLWVNSINGFTPVGGLFSGTSDSLNVAATTAEISIMPLTFVGVGPAVPPNGFSVGDSFELKLSGPFNSANSDTLTIRLKGGPTATTLLSTLVVPLNASSGSVFQLTVFFQIRAIGGAGVADIISDADLTYNQSGAGGAFVGEQSLSQNNTTFDTTVANILDVTAQFGSASASNDMTTRISKLQKTF